MKVSRAGISTPVLIGVVVVVVLVIAGVGFVYLSGSGSKQTTSSSSASGLLDFSTPLGLQAGGSSFVNPIMQTWIFQFQNMTHQQVTVNYSPLGSGAGISGIFSGLYDYAGSDAPVPRADIQVNASGRTLLEIPEALGSVAILYNVPGVRQTLNFSGGVLEQIFLENITMWNDPAIARLNPGVTLPAQTIVVVHRSDGSGTTYALTTYFNDIDPTWVHKVGVGTFVNWPNSPNPELGEQGSGGVALQVNETSYSIGYADSYYAFANGIKAAAIENQAGVFLKPSIAGAAASAAAFTNQVESNATFPIMNAPGAASYPISTYTYLLVWAKQPSAEKADALTVFFWYAINQGQSYSPRLFYAPLPTAVVAFDENLIRQINYNGQSYAPQ
jgi:phosphate transport system substrate-binding protein